MRCAPTEKIFRSPTAHTRARLSFAPPPCRMPLGQSQDIPQTDPRGMATPRFWHRLIRFRHVLSGSLALASLNHTCRNLVPTFPQRSPPSLLTTAACGGLRPAPDCRSRRALLHFLCSSAPSYSEDAFVTRDPFRTFDSAGSGAEARGHIARSQPTANRATGQGHASPRSSKERSPG